LRFGPEKAQIARLNNLYQFQILLKLPRGKTTKSLKTGFDKFERI
jgi:primosomal protein N' (replication factor Y)